MDHDRSSTVSIYLRLLSRSCLCRAVGKLELDWQIEVKLDCGTLEWTLQGIGDCNVDFCVGDEE